MFEIFSSKSLMLTFSFQISHLIINKNDYLIKNIKVSDITKIPIIITVCILKPQ